MRVLRYFPTSKKCVTICTITMASADLISSYQPEIMVLLEWSVENLFEGFPVRI
jgi:hypothetical protein